MGTPPDGKVFRDSIALRDKRIEGDVDVYDWTANDALPGRYKLENRSPRFAITIDVPEGGRRDVVIDVPPPAHVSLRVIDASTREDVAVSQVTWTPKWPDGVNGGGG
ncbi:MAG: hypothetical protein HY292_03685 [Planctomycetes bacterium]|nr:hypothetical protein [Planctomycetota bacterium]